MTILRSEFAMILIVSTKEEVKASDFESHLKELTDKIGLFISIKELPENEIHSKKPYSGIPCMISVIGTDKPGIVYRITELLALKGINITDLNTKVVSGQSAPVYTMIIEVDVPEHVDITLLEGEFSILEKEMAIDISIKEIEILEL
jgi:Glycine cleavage system regulatory protein